MIYNFNPGPSAIPAPVLQEVQKEMFNYKNSGLSVMEMSHRGKHYEEIHFQALHNVRRILQVPDDFEILFLQGGASLQFAMLPMNFLQKDEKGAYVLSGSWSEKALDEGKKIGNTYTLASSKSNQYRSIPSINLQECSEETSYIHITSNNTIFGTQWPSLPHKISAPIFVDASSDIFSRQVDWNHVDLLYAGAQKNAGPSGVTIVIMRKSLLDKVSSTIPRILSYKTHADKDSLYHTPPTASIFMLGLVMKWVDSHGGIEGMEKRAEEKATMLYEVIDNSNSFYVGHAVKDSRSRMNVTFTLHDKTLEKAFLEEAENQGFVGLKGHRSVGGCRASIYNAVPVDHVEKLAQFMKQFQRSNT